MPAEPNWRFGKRETLGLEGKEVPPRRNYYPFSTFGGSTLFVDQAGKSSGWRMIFEPEPWLAGFLK